MEDIWAYLNPKLWKNRVEILPMLKYEFDEEINVICNNGKIPDVKREQLLFFKRYSDLRERCLTFKNEVHEKNREKHSFVCNVYPVEDIKKDFSLIYEQEKEEEKIVVTTK